MKPLPPTRLSDDDELSCTVGSARTMRVKKVGCSVPARLIGQPLKVAGYERELKRDSERELWLRVPRHCGDRGVGLDYRHVMEHLLRKPGALERYRDREPLFPRRSFREAYDQWVVKQGQRGGAVEYPRLLKLASEVGESELEVRLADYLSPPYPAGSVAEWRRMLQPRPRPHLELAE